LSKGNTFDTTAEQPDAIKLKHITAKEGLIILFSGWYSRQAGVD
jgi:hypothetical protein